MQECSNNNWQIKSGWEEDTNQVRATLRVVVKPLHWQFAIQALLIKSSGNPGVSRMIFTAWPDIYKPSLLMFPATSDWATRVVLGGWLPPGQQVEGYDGARALARAYWPLLGHLHPPARAHTTRIITTHAWTPRPPCLYWPPCPPCPPCPP